MQDDYEIFPDAELWLAALVSCGPAFLIAAMMIVSLTQPQFPGCHREGVAGEASNAAENQRAYLPGLQWNGLPAG
ncbi:hypothetical protein ACE10Z_33660 [Bradyrhizobium sp. Pha-3]|uniref:hypothetical protein n=1 Tax=Bradyrhizobium sp. Pha-3 TaxID=208375 RepID=UPI0035D4A3CA